MKNEELKNTKSKSQLNDFGYVNEIFFNVYEILESIFVDPIDSFCLNLISVFERFYIFKNDKIIEGLLLMIKKMQSIIMYKNSSVRYAFYNLLVSVN